MAGKLFTKENGNAKTAKSAGKGYETAILYMAPGAESGYQVCSSSSIGCLNACLFTAGRGRMDNVKKGRIRRTRLFFEQRDEFKRQVIKELTTLVRRCKKNGLKPCVRMNGTSDIVWERVWPELFTLFPTIQFYCYTKHLKRCLPNWNLPSNYHLTFSRSEENDDSVAEVLAGGQVNVAMVFDSKDFPKTFEGYEVLSGDDHDLRFLDNNGKGGKIIALYAKGDAKKDDSGFVLPSAEVLNYSA